MPLAVVYLVKFSSSACFAACLMCSGVEKSGSPTPRSMTLTPCERSFSAAITTAANDDSFVSCARVETGNVAACDAVVLILYQPLFHTFDHGMGNETFNRAAEQEDLFDQARADVGILFGGDQKNGLDLRVETAVHQHHRQFVLVIFDRADAANYRMRLAAARVFDQQALECLYLDLRRVRRGNFGQHLYALGDREHGMFVGVDQNRHDDLVKDVAGALDDVYVSVGQWVE